MNLRETAPEPNDGDRHSPGHLTSAQRLLAFTIAAVVLIVALVAHSAQAVAAVAPPLLLLLAWLTTGTTPRQDGTSRQDAA